VTNERALEIIATHGAEPSRWPAAERAATMALAGSDAAVAAALAEAGRLDALLNGWARDVPVRNFDAAAIVAAARPAVVASPAPRASLAGRWMAGGAVAAAMLGIALIGPGMQTSPATIAAPEATPVVLAAAEVSAGNKMKNSGAAGNAATWLAVADGGALGSDADVFAHVFTPTVYEDNLI
jgi:hypothetical protein